MPRVSKRFIYQRASWQLPTTTNLQVLLSNALRAVREKDRDQPLSDTTAASEGTWRKVIRGVARNGCVFGKLVQFTYGLKQETIRTQIGGAGEPPEGAVQAPDGEEFAGGALYFCVDKDHVIIAQSQGLRIPQLESYLNWLLRVRSGVLAEENYVSLESLPAKDARRILANSVPKAVTFSRPIQLGREETLTASKRYSTDATIDAVQSLMGVDDLRDLLPAAALAGGRIKTSVTFSWSNRVGGQRPDDFLQGIGQFALRHMDEDPEADVEIETSSGKLSRSHLSMAESRSIDTVDGVVVFQTVYMSMLEFLAKLRRENEITD